MSTTLHFAMAFACLLVLTVTFANAGVLSRKPVSAYWHINFTRPNFAVGPIIATWKHGISKWNPDERSGLYGGDIMLPKKPITLTRNGVDYANLQWMNGIVPYVVASTIGSTQLSLIQQAINTIQSATCVKFIPRTTETDYVYFQNLNSGCWSYVGRKGGMQEVNLQTQGCHIVGIAIHELMHTLGFFHEHTRDDRDQYVTIKWENVNPSAKSNFDIWPYRKNTYGVGYDYGSILHYSATAFSINSLPTIVTIPIANVPIGQRSAMTTGDITRIKSMYNCV